MPHPKSLSKRRGTFYIRMYKRKGTFQLLPFSFRLKKSFYLKKAFQLLPLTFLLCSCSFNPAIQGKGETYLQGEWQQDSIAVGKQLVTYSLSNIKFNCDSFYITVNTVSNVNYGADSCMNKGRWTEFMRGKYSQKNDTLHLKGFFYKANGTLKGVNDCFRVGVYEEFFKVKKQSDSLIQLSVNPADIPLNMQLVKRIICTPKPL